MAHLVYDMIYKRTHTHIHTHIAVIVPTLSKYTHTDE